jgi:bifunctional DNA-binding transcriptional regulator/antitoxin component of YhaV-PrlF toxin-antitoxin module
LLELNKMEKEIRKLNKTSNHSYSVIIPKEIVRKYKWRERQRLIVEDKGKGVLTVRDLKKR